jgi:hypothetical protein
MWTAPSLQGVFAGSGQIACVHMSGLLKRSYVNAGQDGFRDTSSKHRSDLITGPLDPPENGSVIDPDAAILRHKFKIAVADGELEILPHSPKDHLGSELSPLEVLARIPHRRPRLASNRTDPTRGTAAPKPCNRTPIVGTYRSISSKHVPCYLAEFEYRFNRRYDLAAMLPRLRWAGVRITPMPYRLAKIS